MSLVASAAFPQSSSNSHLPSSDSSKRIEEGSWSAWAIEKVVLHHGSTESGWPNIIATIITRFFIEPADAAQFLNIQTPAARILLGQPGKDSDAAAAIAEAKHICQQFFDANGTETPFFTALKNRTQAAAKGCSGVPSTSADIQQDSKRLLEIYSVASNHIYTNTALDARGALCKAFIVHDTILSVEEDYPAPEEDDLAPDAPPAGAGVSEKRLNRVEEKITSIIQNAGSDLEQIIARNGFTEQEVKTIAKREKAVNTTYEQLKNSRTSEEFHTLEKQLTRRLNRLASLLKEVAQSPA